MPAALYSIVSSILASTIVYLIDEAMSIMSMDGAMAIMPFRKVLPSSLRLVPEISTDAMPAERNISATIIMV